MTGHIPSAKLRAHLSMIIGRDAGEWCNCCASEAELHKLAKAGDSSCAGNDCCDLIHYVDFSGEVIHLNWDTRTGPGINYEGIRGAHEETIRATKAKFREWRINDAVKALRALQGTEIAEVRRRFRGV